MDEHQLSLVYLVETSRFSFLTSITSYVYGLFTAFIWLYTFINHVLYKNKHMNMMQNSTHYPFFRELLVTEDSLVLMGCQDLR